MSISEQTLSQPEGEREERVRRKQYKLELGVDFDEPWAALAAFQLLREQAALHSFGDVDDIHIHVGLHVSGVTYPRNVEALNHKLESLWLGEFKVLEERELKSE